MNYIALLRGINVGGKNKISMPQLFKVITNAGYKNVSTYINSGNIFLSSQSSISSIENDLHSLIKQEFGLDIKVLVVDQNTISEIITKTNLNIKNDQQNKYDVMFLWPKYAKPQVLDLLTINPAVDNVVYVDKAIIWHVEKSNYNKSGISKLAGTDLYQHMTIRNINTVRKINERFNNQLN